MHGGICMRKGLQIGALVLAIPTLGFLSSFYFYGIKAETRYSADLDLYAKATQGSVEVASVDYHRGWFRSSAETKLNVRDLKNPTQKLPMILKAASNTAVSVVRQRSKAREKKSL